MKTCLDFRWGWAFQLFLLLAITSCTEKKNEGESLALNSESPELATASKEKKALTTDFKTYWYAGDAEITSYTLEQARYGEIREGKAVLIFVTEPFLPDVQVKADRKNDRSIPVLKLNKTKKYLTGIYPYSIMSSTFYPVYDNQHAIKTSLSVQEWCGHVYSQLNNREDFEFTSHSYFEGEADQKSHLNKAILENEEKLFSIKGNMSVLYSAKGDLDQAILLAKECIVYHTKESNKESEIICTSNT